MPCVARKEDNYFFALSKYQKQLEEVSSQNPLFVQPSYRLNEVSLQVLYRCSIQLVLVDLAHSVLILFLIGFLFRCKVG